MSRRLGLLACFALVLSLGTTATAHALERPDVTLASHVDGPDVVVDGHAPGDADQVPADGDRGYPHHHGGCHGDHVAAPVKVAGAAAHVLTQTRFAASGDPAKPLYDTHPALRPPRA